MKHYRSIIFLLLIWSFALENQAQIRPDLTRKIYGKVTLSDTRVPLSGVTIKVKGMEFTTITDTKGKFEFDVPKYYISLIFKRIGFKSKEIRIQSLRQSEFNTSLQIEKTQTGYGTELTLNSLKNNAITSSNLEESFPVAGFEQALSGQLLGLQVFTDNGLTNPTANTVIRGISSVTNGVRPLYIIDGLPLFSEAFDSGTEIFMPFNPLTDISIHEIENISVLKSASATALYGARGANGVIIIKTKEGRRGANFKLGYYAGFSQPTYKPNLLNASKFQELYQEAYLNSGGDSTSFQLPLTLDSVNFGNTNWQDEISQTGSIQNLYFSAQKREKKSNYYISLNYRNEKSFLKKDEAERVNFRFNGQYYFSKKLKIGLNSGVIFSGNSRFPNGLKVAQTALPIIPIQDSLQNYFLPNQNPAFILQNIDYQQNNLQLLGNILAEYTFIKGLKWRAEIGTQQVRLNESYHQANINLTDSRTHKNTISVQNLNLNTYLIWEKAFDWYDLRILTGANLQKIERNQTESSGIGFTNPAQRDLAFAENQNINYSLSENKNYLAYFADIHYMFNGTYSAGFTVRADGSNLVGKNQRYHYYPTVSAGWNIFERDTLSQKKLFSFLKIRTSYGFTGNSNFLSMANQNLYEGQANYGGAFGIRPSSQLGNNKLKPETIRQVDFSFLFGLFDQNITGEINYYHRKTTDLILEYPISYLSGYEIIIENSESASLMNRGWELGLNASFDFTEDFRWQSRLRLNFTKNKVQSLDKQIIENQEVMNSSFVLEKQPIGVWRLAEWAGVNSQTGQAQIQVDGRKLSATSENINQGLTVLGNANPTYFGSFGNEFLYRNLKLSLLFTFAGGHQIYKADDAILLGNFGAFTQKQTDLESRWTTENKNTDIPTLDLAESQYNMTSRYLYDANFVRLKSVNLSYNFDVQRTIHAITIFANVQNLFLWTNFPADPETVQFTSNHRTGFQYFTPPQSRVFTAGFFLEF